MKIELRVESTHRIDHSLPITSKHIAFMAHFTCFQKPCNIIRLFSSAKRPKFCPFLLPFVQNSGLLKVNADNIWEMHMRFLPDFLLFFIYIINILNVIRFKGILFSIYIGTQNKSVILKDVENFVFFVHRRSLWSVNWFENLMSRNWQ